MGPNEDAMDITGGDFEVSNSDKCVCVLSSTSSIYRVKLGFINNCKESQL
jgi:hypothetical protein